MSKKIELGTKVEDVVTGFIGTVTSRAEYLHGSPRISIVAASKDGKPGEELWIEEARVVEVL